MRAILLEEIHIQTLLTLLNVLPNEPIPEGLDPTFYHTLRYEDDVKLQNRVDEIRKRLLSPTMD